MTYEPRVGEEVATIKSDGYSVRVAMENGKALFACKDVLSLCGYRCTSEVAKNMAESPRTPGVIKMIAYPVVGERGMRRIQMYFADGDAVKEMIARSNVGGDVKKWLEESVLTYKPVNPPAPIAAPVTSAEETPTPNAFDYDRLNRSIDRILVELMEIKKNLMIAR